MGETTVSSSERRIFPRKTLRTQVVFEDENGEGFIYFYSTDLSEGGIFLEHDVPLRLGTKLFLSFRLPDQQLIRATGEVVRQANIQNMDPKITHSDGIIGMGIRFMDLDSEQSKILKDFIGETPLTTD